MTYQKANYIKSAGLSNLIEQNMRSGKGFLRSTGGAIGSKFQARLTGVKETFDPLNFFRFMSRGSPLAFRLLGGRAFGRLTGRNEDDVDYFAGGPGSRAGGRPGFRRKNKKSAEPLNTSIGSGKKIIPIMAGDSVADEITKIYTLLKHSYEDKAKKSEIQKNFEEGKREKEEKRHKELIKALMSVGGKGDKPTATKTDDKSWYMIILDILKDAWNKIRAFAESVGKIVEGIITKVKSVFSYLWNKITSIAEFIWSKITGIVKTIASKIAQIARIILPEKVFTLISEGIEGLSKLPEKLFGSAAKTEAKTAEKVAEKTVGKTILKGIPILGIGAGLFFGAERALAGDWVGAGLEVAGGVAGSIPGVGTAAEIGLGAAAAIHESNFDAEKANAPTATPLPPTGAGGGRGMQGVPTVEQSTSATPTAVQQPSVIPSGVQMVQATKENMESQIETQLGGAQSITLNKTNSSSIASNPDSSVISETVVRNDEDSLLKIMKGSLRMV